MVHEPASFKLGKMIDSTELLRCDFSFNGQDLCEWSQVYEEARTSEIILLLSCHSVQVHSGDSHSVQVQSGDSHSVQVQSGHSHSIQIQSGDSNSVQVVW